MYTNIISTLSKENVSLIDTNDYLKLQVQNLQETLKNERELSATQIAELRNQIKYLEELLEAFNEPNMIPVTFYSNNSVYDVVLVNKEEYLDVSKVVNPTLTGYQFDYPISKKSSGCR